MDDIKSDLIDGGSKKDFLEAHIRAPESAASFSLQTQQDTFLSGSEKVNLMTTVKIEADPESTETSITGNKLPPNWPEIASPEEEQKGYDALYNTAQDRSKPPDSQHIDKLSFSIRNGDKELRYLAVQHIFGVENRNHPQFAALKANFETQKPQIVLLEGPAGNPTAITEKEAIKLGDKAYMQYLVLEHNKNLKQGEEQIKMESADLQPEDEPEKYRKKGYTNEEIAANEVLKWMYYETQGIKNTPGLTQEQIDQRIQELQSKYEANLLTQIDPSFFSRVPRSDGQEWSAQLVKEEIERQTGNPLRVDFNYLQLPKFKQMFDDARQFRDQHIVREIAKASKTHDRVMVVMGSGHAIRDVGSLEQFYENKAEPISNN